MNLQKFKAFLIAKKNYLIAISLVIIVFLLSLVLLVNSLQIKQAPDKTWQIELNYDQKNQKLILDKLNLISGKYIPDTRNSLYSPYSIEVLDKNGKTLYSAKINVTEQVLYDLFPIATMPASFSTEAKSVIFVPYELNSSKIVILKNNKNVLEVNLPQTLSFKFIQNADAIGAAISCGPVTTVFINDNYTNVDQFKSDVSYLENLYNTTPPYNLNPSIFDFKEVDQAQNFGCQTTGIKSCIENKISNIKNAGLQNFPSAQKFIVLVDNPNAISVDGGLAGLVNGVGGDVIIYTNFVYSGLTGGKPFAAASHELEGHSMGYLWDRYVSSDQNYSAIPQGFPQSNCSTNSSGESFWPSSGSTGTYKGCANQNQYAPFPLTCKSYMSTLISGGTNDTIMSAIGCSTNQFDSVEQSWIRNNILPYYKPCGGTPQPTISPTPMPSPSPTPTQTPSPTPTPTPIAHSIKGIAFVDTNGNGQKDPGENPFSNLTVSLSGAYTATAVTDSSGNYSFNNLPTGTYTISASNSTYEISFGSTSFSINANTQQVTISFPVPAQALATPTPVPSQNPLVTPTPTPTPSPVPFPTISATQASPTPASSNPSATYTCVFDPSCVSGQSSIQICPLKCTPNP